MGSDSKGKKSRKKPTVVSEAPVGEDEDSEKERSEDENEDVTEDDEWDEDHDNDEEKRSPSGSDDDETDSDDDDDEVDGSGTDHKEEDAPVKDRPKPKPKKGKGKVKAEEPPPKRGIPMRFIAPIAVIVGILIVGAIVLVFVMNSGSSITEIFVGNPEPRDMDDDLYTDSFGETLYIPMYANSDGWASAKGTATLEVTFENDPKVLYSEKVSISDGSGATFVPLSKFVQGNGEYTFTARTGDATTEPNHFRVYWVTESLQIKWGESNKDVAPTTHSYQVGFTLSPKEKSGKNLSMAPMPYAISGTFSKPAGGDESVKVTWPATSSYIITRTTEHTMKGTYSLDIEWTNLMCASNSPYYKVRLTNSTYVDSIPFADAGDDQTVSMVDGNVTVSFDGSGSFDDGSIVQYRWDFDDGSTAITDTPYTTHVYSATGEYYVGLIVVDDTGHDSETRWGGSVTVAVNP